jgi:hypothetical protein
MNTRLRQPAHYNINHGEPEPFLVTSTAFLPVIGRFSPVTRESRQ